MKFLNKILNFFKALFKKDKSDNNESQPSPVISNPSENNVSSPSPSPEAPKEVNPEWAEPEQSSPDGTITSFLWKDSDTNPKGAVVSVSSDTLRAADVLMILRDSKGNIIKANQKYNAGGHLRGNKLPGHKYGRFNFKPGGTIEYYSKFEPIIVSFAFVWDKKRFPIKVMGKDSIVIKNARQRLDLK